MASSRKPPPESWKNGSAIAQTASAAIDRRLTSTFSWNTVRTAISAHDAIRANASPTPSPALPAVQWSADVESVAQQWANHCVYEHNAARGNLGENIAASSPGVWPTIVGVVQAWASEVADYDYASNTCAPGKVCGHYTQLVWRESTLIGCAYARCTENSPFPGFSTWDFWVCDYAPPGNWVGQRPY